MDVPRTQSTFLDEQDSTLSARRSQQRLLDMPATEETFLFGHDPKDVVNVPIEKLKHHLCNGRLDDSVVLRIQNGDIPAAVAIVKEVQSRARRRRRFLATDQVILIKEVHSNLHARIAGYVQTQLLLAFVECVPRLPNGTHDFSLFDLSGDGRLQFALLQGEPDAGLSFSNEEYPFALIEVGVADSGSKTRIRAQHWLTHGKPNVAFTISTKVGRGDNFQLSELEVAVYYTDMASGIRTQNFVHGKPALYDSVDFLNSARTHIRVATAAVAALTIPNGTVFPAAGYIDVDLSALQAKALAGLRFN